MKLRTIFILSTILIVVCYVSPVKAQSQVTRLEEGTLNWKVENRQLSHYSVTKKDGTKLPKDKYIGSLRDFSSSENQIANSGEVHFVVDDRGTLNGPFKIDYNQGQEVITGNMKNGGYDGDLDHFLNGDKVSSIHYKDGKILKTTEFTDDGKRITNYTHKGEQVHLETRNPDGSYFIADGTANEYYTSKNYTADSVLVRSMDYLNNELKEWDSKGKLKLYHYEEKADSTFVNKIEEKYTDGIITEKKSWKLPKDNKSTKESVLNTEVYYNANGKKRFEHIYEKHKEKSGEVYHRVSRFDAQEKLIRREEYYFDKKKNTDMFRRLYFEDGQVVGEDNEEIPFISAPE